ncbi:Scavenger receptor class B member 1 [Frankliniella fusca]|uniref:Scavenger receptor class B member 1 n=1 Tax=Frankliniella fusca TaxID=407009 RepID=A0AAE1HSC9_9NEOP|nr:Scavenger receptor class B member 1 [Frankliniella fusca]
MKAWPEKRQSSMKRPLRPRGCSKYSTSMGVLATKGIAGLCVAFLFCLAGTTIMWCTSLFQDLVTGTMVISNSSNTWDWWRAPPVSPLLMVYIFNYTNADTFGQNGQKLRVKEVGPFTYRETTEKVDFKFYNNATLSYHEKKTYEFIPEMSAFPETAKVFVPNIPFLSAVATARERSLLERWGMNMMLRGFDSKPILHIDVRDLLFGYEDRLFNIAKMTAINGRIPFQKFGLMVPKVGISEHEITMHTGAGDMSRLGQIVNFNGRDSQGVWRSDECNAIQGSDGAQFPPLEVSTRARLWVYNRDMCRHAPVVMSFPHFLHGDPSLLHNVEGLRPQSEKHDMFVDIHPNLGLTLGGVSRLQVNVQVRHAPGVMGQTMSHFKDQSILPVAWFELEVQIRWNLYYELTISPIIFVPLPEKSAESTNDPTLYRPKLTGRFPLLTLLQQVTEFPSALKNLLYHATFTVHILQLLLMYGFLAGGIASAAVLFRRLCLRERGTLDLSAESPDSDSS